MKRFLLADIPYLQTKSGRTRAFTCGDPLPIELAPLAWEPARAHRAGGGTCELRAAARVGKQRTIANKYDYRTLFE